MIQCVLRTTWLLSNGLVKPDDFFFAGHEGHAVRLPDRYRSLSWIGMSHHKSVTDQTLPSRRVLPSRFSSSALVCWRGGTSSCQSHVKGGIMCMRTVSMFKRGKKEKLWTCFWMVARGCDGLSILPKRTWFYDNANGVQRPFKTRYQLNGEPLKTRMHSAIKLLHSLTLSASPG